MKASCFLPWIRTGASVVEPADGCVKFLGNLVMLDVRLPDMHIELAMRNYCVARLPVVSSVQLPRWSYLVMEWYLERRLAQIIIFAMYTLNHTQS